MEEKVIKKCHWCGEELSINAVEQKSNARGYGYYITCHRCNRENVIQEIDLTREF